MFVDAKGLPKKEICLAKEEVEEADLGIAHAKRGAAKFI